MTVSIAVLTVVFMIGRLSFFETEVWAQATDCESCSKLRSEFDNAKSALGKIKDLIGQNEAYLKVPRSESQIIKVKSNLMLLSLKVEGHEATMKADKIEMTSNLCSSKCGTSTEGL